MAKLTNDPTGALISLFKNRTPSIKAFIDIIVFLVEANELSAVELILNHFMQQPKVRDEFLKLLPDSIRKILMLLPAEEEQYVYASFKPVRTGKAANRENFQKIIVGLKPEVL